MLRVQGMTPEKIHKVHAELQIDTIEQLESRRATDACVAPRAGGPKTAEKILKGHHRHARAEAISVSIITR